MKKKAACTNLDVFKEWLKEVSKYEVSESFAEDAVGYFELEAVPAVEVDFEMEPSGEIGQTYYYTHEVSNVRTKSGNPQTFDVEFTIVATED